MTFLGDILANLSSRFEQANEWIFAPLLTFTLMSFFASACLFYEVVIQIEKYLKEKHSQK